MTRKLVLRRIFGALLEPLSLRRFSLGRYCSHKTCSDVTENGDFNVHITKRIYILGAGNVGSFVAHSLAGVNPGPPITLLFRQKHLRTWQEQGEKIDILSNGTWEGRTGFGVELSEPMGAQSKGLATPIRLPNEPIHSLVVAVKASGTVSALQNIRERLTPQSTLLFLQNGMGVLDEVDKMLFKHSGTRPFYMHGIFSHGLHKSKPFVITHAGNGTIALGNITKREQPSSSKYLQRTLQQAKVLEITPTSQEELLKLQWEKLVVNAVINPLTAVMDRQNESILQNNVSQVVQSLCHEISAVIQALPEMDAYTKMAFGPDRLVDLVKKVATTTGKNISSMLQDVRACKPTEIDYITGYIVKRADELGTYCGENRKLLRLVVALQHERRQKML